MTIEFQVESDVSAEGLVRYLQDVLIELSHESPAISRAEVSIRTDHSLPAPDNRVCQVRLLQFGEDLMAYSRTADPYQSARQVAELLRKMVKEQNEGKRQAPDDILTTVSVK